MSRHPSIREAICPPEIILLILGGEQRFWRKMRGGGGVRWMRTISKWICALKVGTEGITGNRGKPQLSWVENGNKGGNFMIKFERKFLHFVQNFIKICVSLHKTIKICRIILYFNYGYHQTQDVPTDDSRLQSVHHQSCEAVDCSFILEALTGLHCRANRSPSRLHLSKSKMLHALKKKMPLYCLWPLLNRARPLLVTQR